MDSTNYSTNNITNFCRPGIYAIKNTITKELYIGQSQNIIVRLKQHLDLLSINKGHSNLQTAWNKYGGEANFDFIILELGDHLNDSNTRLYYEKRYLNIYRKRGVYNFLPSRVQNELNKIQQNKNQGLPLQFLNLNISCLKSPGIYVIKNKLNNKKYIGESSHLICQLGKDILDLHFKRFPNKEFNRAWKQNNWKKIFTFSILKFGNNFCKKSTRLSYKKRYINLFSPYVYNLA